MPIWPDSYLSQLISDAEEDVVNQGVINIFNRFSISVTNGLATYTLPSNVKRILFVTWKGKPLTPITQKEAVALDTTYRTNKSEPQFYLRESDNFYIMRFYPVPNETIASDDTNIYGSDIKNRVIVSAYIAPDTTSSVFIIPSYIGRRLIKEYVCHMAFKSEGDGQNLRASDYFLKKYQRGLSLTKDVIKSLNRSEENVPSYNVYTGKPARPVLGVNFGTLVD